MNKDKKSSPEKAKELILYAAKVEFAEKGFDGARMGSIAIRAGATQSLIHYYYNSKEELYNQVLRRLFGGNLIDMVSEFINNFGETPDVKLYISIYLSFKIQSSVIDPDFRRIVNRELADERVITKKVIKEYATSHFEIVENWIQAGIKQGIFATKTPLLVVLIIKSFIMDYINGMAIFEGTPFHKNLYAENSGQDEAFDFLVNIIFKSLCPEDKKLKVPDLSNDSMKIVDRFVEEMTENLKWKIEGI